MRAMRDSGVPWIGEIPVDWGTMRFKYLNKGMNTGEGIDKDFWTTDTNDTVFYTAGSAPIRTNYRDFPTWKYTKKNDLLLSRNGTPYVYLPVEDACYTDHIIRAAMVAGVNKQFIRYSLQQSISSVVVDSVSLATWSASLWNKQTIAWPSSKEQQSIVAYLDAECARIDVVMEQTRASIEEYKKLKQSIITEAVTKGIRPNRPMKDSGIDWIGQIPEDWEVARFKTIAQVKANLVHPDEYADYLQVSPENIEKGTGRLLPCKTVSEMGIISDNHLFYKGQILYSKIRPKLNKVTIAPFDGLCSADMYPIETTGSVRFIVYAMLSDVLLSQVSMITEDRVKMPKINQIELGNTWFTNPPIEEQCEIAEYLDARCNSVDGLINQKEKLLSELECYKKSLIYEYVTGKKEA